MTNNLQRLINSACTLSPLEQVELLRAISHFLYQHYQNALPTSDFWHPRTLDEIASAQPVGIVQDISALRIDVWPEDETTDEFIEYVYAQRKEDCLLER
ncbi:hypothetical protein D6779_10530 [Candidatus Parcubacteria bacterium]|nr:MAG: hypothetical protein D6779_10530 [Candidatus Parcubacteria bacterium]